MRLLTDGDRLEWRDVPWHYWGSGALIVALVSSYLAALWYHSPEVNWSLPIWAHGAIGALFVGVAGFLALHPILTCRIDGAARELVVERLSLLGRRLRRVPFASIAEVGTQTAYDTDDKSLPPQYRLRVRLTSGETLPLTVWHRDGAAVTAAAEAMRRLLGRV